MSKQKSYAPGPIDARGCFTGEFGLGDDLDIDQAPYVIERDRINEGKLPGFNRKLLPMKLDKDSGERTAGGYYLLDTLEQAKYMYDWYQDPVNGYVLDGIPILQRSYFLGPLAHYWQVAGAHDFKSIDDAQRIVRFQRWRCRQADLEAVLMKAWPEIRDQAESLQLSAVWLLFNPEQEESVALVTVSQGANSSEKQPDFEGVNRLASITELREAVEKNISAELSFDRSSWVYSIWFPFTSGTENRKTLWPNSPPFPGI